MFGDGLCVTIHPLLLLSWIPSLFASVTSLLHLVFHNCSDLPSDVSIEFSKLAENSSTYRVFNVSSPLTESSSKLSLFSHCPHVTASTDVLKLFASRLHRCLRGIAGRTRRQSQHGLLGFSFVGLRAIHLGFLGIRIRATCSCPVLSSWRKRLLAPGQQHSTWYPIRITLVNGRDFDKMQVSPALQTHVPHG